LSKTTFPAPIMGSHCFLSRGQWYLHLPVAQQGTWNYSSFLPSHPACSIRYKSGQFFLIRVLSLPLFPFSLLLIWADLFLPLWSHLVLLTSPFWESNILGSKPQKIWRGMADRGNGTKALTWCVQGIQGGQEV
jgi:hypothetical protein